MTTLPAYEPEPTRHPGLFQIFEAGGFSTYAPAWVGGPQPCERCWLDHGWIVPPGRLVAHTVAEPPGRCPHGARS